MRSVFSWFITALAVMFWIFRVIVAVMETIKVDFIVAPIDMNIEIALLFITVPCLIMIFKRNIIGGVAYFGIYAWYFGTELARIVESAIENGSGVLPLPTITSAMVCIVALLISLLNLFDIVFARYRKSENPSKKVDWFYKNENFDREVDERADKNNYKIY